MEKAKICLSIDWANQDSANNLTRIKNVIRSFDPGTINYLALDPTKSSIGSSLEYDEIDLECREKEISWFPIVPSIRDIDSTRPYYSKLPNGGTGFMLGISETRLKDFALLKHARDCSDYLILYTGGSTQSEIDRAIEASQPDIVVHHSFGEPRLDYIKYLQAISIEFEKRYSIGFKNNSFLMSDILLLGASMLGATFLESTFSISEFNEAHLLDNRWQFDQLIDVINHIKSINASRGGYGVRRVTKVEKEMMKR
jgi:hypothetical protein